MNHALKMGLLVRLITSTATETEIMTTLLDNAISSDRVDMIAECNRLDQKTSVLARRAFSDFSRSEAKVKNDYRYNFYISFGLTVVMKNNHWLITLLVINGMCENIIITSSYAYN